MKLQDKIAYYRRKAGLSQEALAERLGVSRQAVSKWETGDAVPEVGKLLLLSRAFGVTADALLSEDAPEDAAPEPASADAEKSEPHAATWVDAVPGVIGKLLRRYGWLFGVYTAIAGAVFTLFGALAHGMVRSMSSFDPFGFGPDPFSGGGTIWYDEAGNVLSSPFGSPVSGFATSNPVSTMGTVILILGIVMIIAGIILAVCLKKRSRD